MARPALRSAARRLAPLARATGAGRLGGRSGGAGVGHGLEILDQQRKIIEEQKKRLLETGSVSTDAKYALETPIPTALEPMIGADGLRESRTSLFEVGTGKDHRPIMNQPGRDRCIPFPGLLSLMVNLPYL